MKNIISTLLLLSALLFGAPIMAGGGHEHDSDGGHSQGPVSSDNVINRALKKVKQMTDAGKIDSTWSGVKTANAEQKTYSKGPEWVVTFKNDKINDAEKQTLYLFFSLDGHYIATNYTGS
jgi:hypothetical protein